MQYALVSDLHANLQAWNAVLLDIRSYGIDRIICLGDIVGYGPHPAEVLSSVHANVDHVALGNHDAVLARKLTPELFNPNARDIILWTQDQLNRQAVRFIASLPLALKNPLFRCTHGDFSDPAAFLYVQDAEDAAPSLATVSEPLLFVGHTHQPGMAVLGRSGIPHWLDPVDFEMEPEKRYLVNVGSVGQPRDGEARACYCIFDTDTRSLFWRRIPFDLDAYQQALTQAGLPAMMAAALKVDPRGTREPVRPELDFSPASRENQKATKVIEVAEITQLQSRLTRWRATASAGLLTLLILGFGMGWIWHRQVTQSDRLQLGQLLSVPAWTVPRETSLVVLPTTSTEPDAPIPGWLIERADKRQQAAHIAMGPQGPILSLLSEVSKPLRVSSAPLEVRPGMRLCMEAEFFKSPTFKGSIAVVVSLTKTSGDIVDQFLVKEPNLARKDGWLGLKKTFQLPAHTRAMHLAIRGRFTGSVEVKELSLKRR